MKFPWQLSRGARKKDNNTVEFSVWAPFAEDLSLLLPDRKENSSLPMIPDDDGCFKATIEGEHGLRYGFSVNGSELLPDPVSRFQPEGVFGPSQVINPNIFNWTDSGWAGIRMSDLLIYEVHVGTATAEGTYNGLSALIPYLLELGVTAIELMPLNQFPGSRNWGYDGVQLYAPQNSYGSPDELKSFVNECHRNGLAVILDVVYNHLGPEGNFLGQFGPYFTDRYQTPWGKAVNFDDANSDEVRRFFIENALYWITEYHIDGLRLDAVHAIYDQSAEHLLEELTRKVHQQAKHLNKEVVVIAESDLNDPRLITDHKRGGYNMDGQWTDDFHHAIHAYLTGEHQGYYIDFGSAKDIAKSFASGFTLSGDYSEHRKRVHGRDSSHVSTEKFVTFIQNHDQVGNRARGDRLSKLVSFEKQKQAAALLLLSPYVPLLFMGEEYAETAPFLYFVDHYDEELIDAVRKGRKAEFASFSWQGEVPDPKSKETFEASRINIELRSDGVHSLLFKLYKRLINLKKHCSALKPGDATREVTLENELITVNYRIKDSLAACLIANLSEDERQHTHQQRETELTLQLSTFDTQYCSGKESSFATPTRLSLDECPEITLAANGVLFFSS